jgi:hypothetical protein
MGIMQSKFVRFLVSGDRKFDGTEGGSTREGN